MNASRRGRGTSAGLSRESIVTAGTRVARRLGLSNVSLRLVAQELDVTPASLYNHMADKEELIDAIADAFIRDLLEQPLPADPMRRIRELVTRLHRAGIDQPGMLSNTVGHIPEMSGSAQMAYAEQMLAALIEAGASEPQAHVLYRLLVTVAVGASVAAANLRAPRRRPLQDRVADRIADTGPLTARYLARHPSGRRDDISAHLDFILRDLPAEPEA